ncbi:hypothetical protein HPT25_10440 [Bacillus sp. BRMEA1]|uniref:hypothetical protein n=1 Tax=Neobacillus endophyticus TaxID=2738405 RepID=UPI001565BAFF|nr:hypothetical protein [Neobacillus endophyticus]NRD77826.1 hypothetical protein [Neobacillus endophyticus]
MFLAELQPEEKIAFIELAALIAKADGNVSVFESTVLNKYQKEMGLEDYQIKGLAIDDILNTFQKERSKNIVLTELFQLIFADGVYHDREVEIVQIIKEHFGFDSSEFSDFKDWIDKIKELSIS